MNKNNIVIRSCFGHEIFALWVAKAHDLGVVIVPNKDTKEDFDKESQKIFDNMSFFYDKVQKVDFSEKEEASKNSWDVVADLINKTLPDSVFEKISMTKLTPCKRDNLPQYNGLKNKTNVLVVMQKWLSDGLCGITAEQQSLPVETFEFLKNRKENFIFGQHFDKNNDLQSVLDVAKEYNMYVPGITENKEVLGIRRVKHEMYENMYQNINFSIGIAGTHTWYMLAVHPEISQEILYNNHGTENWQKIADILNKNGRTVCAVGFDDKTDIKKLKSKMYKSYLKFVQNKSDALVSYIDIAQKTRSR